MLMSKQPLATDGRESCTHCNGSGWRWVKIYTARYNSTGEVSQPCPNCNPETYARFKAIALEGQKAFDAQEADNA